jgi:hypothetical protein
MGFRHSIDYASQPVERTAICYFLPSAQATVALRFHDGAQHPDPSQNAYMQIGYRQTNGLPFPRNDNVRIKVRADIMLERLVQDSQVEDAVINPEVRTRSREVRKEVAYEQFPETFEGTRKQVERRIRELATRVCDEFRTRRR